MKWHKRTEKLYVLWNFHLLRHLLSRHDFANIGSKHPVLIVKSKYLISIRYSVNIPSADKISFSEYS